MSVNVVIAITEPDDGSETIEQQNEMFEVAEDFADELTSELRSRFGPGWKAEVSV